MEEEGGFKLGEMSQIFIRCGRTVEKKCYGEVNEH